MNWQSPYRNRCPFVFSHVHPFQCYLFLKSQYLTSIQKYDIFSQFESVFSDKITYDYLLYCPVDDDTENRPLLGSLLKHLSLEIPAHFNVKMCKITHIRSIVKHLNLNKNQNELSSHDSIWDIPEDKFMIMHNGIVWNIYNLQQYIKFITMGVNEYDAKIPSYAGQNIWDTMDLEFIYTNFGSSGSKIKKYLDHSKLRKLYSEDELKFLEECASIFWARGDPFDQQLLNILDQDEQEEWSDRKSNISDLEMPYLSNRLYQKIDTLKQEQLFKYHKYYADLSDENIELMAKKDYHLGKKVTQKIINGKECIMIYGRSLTQFCRFLRNNA